ncbi:MAG: NAD(P)-dependent oxidoreductase [Nitrosospira sp.]|nr:NAD(P)-dependent oxidoreductase [Nitrosospira sp.]
MSKRVAVIGASGFVGATLVERALQSGLDVVPIIHSSGNAWRLTRHGIPLRAASLLDKQQLTSALKGCTHVVNCSRGGDDVMYEGLANLLQVSSSLGISGLVHLSSVAVYGDPPLPDSNVEGGTTAAQPGTYGWIKLRQDQMVEKAAAQGLPCAILCPPNIGGPYSGYLTSLIEALRSRSLLLMDDGNAVMNIVDVHNLCHAIELSLDRCSKEARRMFVTDDEEITWKQVIDGLIPVCGTAIDVPVVSMEALSRFGSQSVNVPRSSITRSLKHLVSDEVRAAIRKDPLLAKAEIMMRRSVTFLGTGVEQRLKLSVGGPPPLPKIAEKIKPNIRLSAQQLRGVRHSCELAKREIGYVPQYSFHQSMKAFRAWYSAHTGVNDPSWELSRYLWLKPEFLV